MIENLPSVQLRQPRRMVQLPVDVPSGGGVPLDAYTRAVQATDSLPADDLTTASLGLFGEIGGVLAIVKKKRRDTVAYSTYDAAIVEELGDVLWYFTCIAARAGVSLTTICEQMVGYQPTSNVPTWGNVQQMFLPAGSEPLVHLARIAERAGALVGNLCATSRRTTQESLVGDLTVILRELVLAVNAAALDLDVVARENLAKIFSRWPLDTTYPPLVDSHMPPNERLPRTFEMLIAEQTVADKTYVILSRNDVIIGDRLTDNKAAEDDYRFHDVFHIAYAVHLGWSPVLRALFHVKRKSAPAIDESEDGQRAILIEEGISTFIFGRALDRDLFTGLARLDFDLLKLVQSFTHGYEADRCSLWQWERAILDGFRLFRLLKEHRRGYIVADLEAHTLDFRQALASDLARDSSRLF